MTDPQTAADAAERVQAYLDARRQIGDTRKTIASVEPDPCAIPMRIVRLIEADLVALLEDRARMAAELEQVRGDLARARDDSSEVWLAERGEEMRDALTVAAELIDRLVDDGDCDIDHNGYCQGHALHEEPCPHPLGRRFVEAWRTVQAEATAGMAASAAPDATGDTLAGERRADGQRDLTKLEGPQRGSEGDGVLCLAGIPEDIAKRIGQDPDTLCALLLGHTDPTHDDGHGLSWQGPPVPPGTSGVCCAPGSHCACCGGPR